ncbi:hypothetical protein GYMLUDRAFT_253154 [Collybiopsis luxurians FD-317 M1]|uniref:DDE Tnp4 domain-containing protein n=1 Tax=Collybiopsis luxurians FD-317 M1 TaxID=944289 RepID=A0A0D0B7Y4_9AGAR|nr:hypothetical protein GYMLUDRAFT_253154 [Collybiopsis luxurians FD-317 M1]
MIVALPSVMQQLPFVLQQQTEQEDNKQMDLSVLTLAALASGVLEHKIGCIRWWSPSHLYLTRAQLMPNPRLESPWICLWRGQDDWAFITTMGFDVATFHFILEGHGHFAEVWNSTPIPHGDVFYAAVPCAERRSLDAARALGLVLHYLSSAILEVQLQQIFTVVPSVLTCYLSFSLDILLATLHKMKEARIALPETQAEFAELSSLIVARHSLLKDTFGSIDGLSLPAQVLDNPEIENATYNGWKTDHTIMNVLMFSLKGQSFLSLSLTHAITDLKSLGKGTIIDAVLNAPGSWHDAHTAKPIFQRLHNQVPDGFYVISDTAFP